MIYRIGVLLLAILSAALIVGELLGVWSCWAFDGIHLGLGPKPIVMQPAVCSIESTGVPLAGYGLLGLAFAAVLWTRTRRALLPAFVVTVSIVALAVLSEYRWDALARHQPVVILAVVAVVLASAASARWASRGRPSS
jgi:hypothetical protein